MAASGAMVNATAANGITRRILDKILDPHTMDLTEAIDGVMADSCPAWTKKKALRVAMDYRHFLAILLIAEAEGIHPLPIPHTEDVFWFWEAHYGNRGIYNNQMHEIGVQYMHCPMFIIRTERRKEITSGLLKKFFPEYEIPEDPSKKTWIEQHLLF